MTVNQRIKNLQEYYFPNDLTEFSKKTAVPKSTLTEMLKGENEPSFKNILKIIVAFPQISSDWLLLGEGEMLKPNFKTYDKYISESQLLSKKNTFGNITGYNNVEGYNVEGYNVEGDLKNNSDNSSHYDSKLLEEIEALKKENQRLQIESQGFQTENQRFQIENQKLQIENAKLTGKLEAYTEMRK